MSASSVPSLQLTPTGPVLPAETDILNGVLSDIDAAFGGGTNPSLETPQGQLASSLAAIIGDKNNEIAAVINNIDPDTAADRWQDAIGRIYFIDRLPATSTTVTVTCAGLAGTVIPVGAQVIDTAGNIYACTGAGTIPVGGSIDLQFAAANTGPTVLAAGGISGIYKAIPGWDTATNANAGVTGSNVESRADFEYRRRQSVAINAAGSLPSIYANVFAVKNVTDVYVTENPTAASVTKGSITLPPHSVYVAAVGGLDNDVAAAIWQKKPPGADYVGNTSATVTDTSGYAAPYPTYTVKFQRPAAQPIYFNVSIANTVGLPSDIVTQIQNAIVSAFAGGDGGPRVRIGATVYASRFYAPVVNLAPGYVEILSLQMGLTAAGANQNALNLDIGYVPTVSAANISVTLV